MKVLKATAASIALAVFGATGVMAQGATNGREQPNPPAPAMQPPDSMAPSSDGSSAGDTGVSAPAGNPSDPTTNENVQPGPSTSTPNDPATGSDPSSRLPTAP